MDDMIKLVADDIKEEVKKRVNDRLSERYKGFYRFILPPIDIIEKKDSLIIIADLPGFSKENIELSMVGEYLKITAQRKEESEGTVHLRERPDHIYRYVKIPIPVEKEKISAKHENGLLTITLPVKSEMKINVD
jgi:HSP20 family molecular chaperone IbpA